MDAEGFKEMNMPRIKLLILKGGKHIWYPTSSDIAYYDSEIFSVWIEEHLTMDEFKEFSKKIVFLKNRG